VVHQELADQVVHQVLLLSTITQTIE
jgi:hypothetical protein